MEAEEIRAYLKTHQEELVRRVCDFVRIPSVSGDKAAVYSALRYALELGASLGFRTEAVLDGQVGVIEMGEGDEVLGILAHVDVVAPGDRALWRTEPFAPEIIDGAIYGRGTLDDKGAIVASLYAMKAVAESGQPLRKKVRMILGTQEEVDWTDMRAYTAAYPPPSYGFSPDGEFPVCNIEKGSYDVDLAFPLDAEGIRGGGECLVDVEAGTAFNIVPGSCTASLAGEKNGALTKRTIHMAGKSVHSCQPEKGENAILLMAAELERQGLAENRLLGLMRMIGAKFGDLNGGALGLCSPSEYFEGEFVHRNVFAPTVLSVRENELRLHINARFGYGTDPDALTAGFEALAAEYGGRVARTTALPAVFVSRERPFLRAFASAYEEMTGLKNEFTLAYGGSYAKAMPNVVSWGPIFPGEADTCHEENEFISIQSMMANAEIFASAIDKIVCSEESFL